jgi:hypothetical protein
MGMETFNQSHTAFSKSEGRIHKQSLELAQNRPPVESTLRLDVFVRPMNKCLELTLSLFDDYLGVLIDLKEILA